MSAGFRAFFHCEPLDLLHEGLDESLDRLKGEIGVDGISVTAIGGPLHLLRARGGSGPRTFRTAGGAWFQPAADAYADARLRPPVAEGIRSSNPIEKIAAACRRRDLRLRLRVSVCDVEPAAQRWSFAACKDAFGDLSPARLCPSNPDVRAYAESLVGDLAAHVAPDAVDLDEADFGVPATFHSGRENPADPGAWHASTYCFCESCRQSARDAGLDIDRLQAAARQPVAAADAAACFAPLADHRALAVRRLIDGARRRFDGELGRRIADLNPHRGLRPGDFGEIVDLWIPSNASALAAPPQVDPGALAATFVVSDSAVQTEGSAGLVRDMLHAVRGGRRTLLVESFGGTSDERLEWVRQAIRFARRDSGASLPA